MLHSFITYSDISTFSWQKGLFTSLVFPPTEGQVSSICEMNDSNLNPFKLSLYVVLQ